MRKRRRKNNKGAATLRKITRKAKEIIRKHPTWSWQHAIKEASKQIKKKR